MSSARAALVTRACRQYHVGRVPALEMIRHTPEYAVARDADRAREILYAFPATIERFLLAMGRIQVATRAASKAFNAFTRAAR